MATTCKKCFAPLASTERICHSCGAPIDMTQSSTWGGDEPLPKNPFVSRPRRPVKPSVVATPSVAAPIKDAPASQAPEIPKIPEATVTETELNTVRSAAEIGAQTQAVKEPAEPPVIPEAPTPEGLDVSGDSPLPLPPTGGDTVSPTQNLSVSLDSVPQAKPDKKTIRPNKVKGPKNPNKKDNLPLYALIVTALIAIGLAAALIYVLSTNSTKTETQSEVITSTVIEPYPARIGAFSVEVPDGILYTNNGSEAILYDDTQTWSIYATSVDFGMSDIEMKSSQIVENFRAAGYGVGEPETKNYSGVDFLTIEVINGESSMVVAYTAADGAHSFAMSIVTASQVADYTVLESIAEIFQTAKIAGNSPVSADENGINRTFVSDFTPYIPPEAQQPENPENPEQPEQPVEPAPEVPAEPQAY